MNLSLPHLILIELKLTIRCSNRKLKFGDIFWIILNSLIIAYLKVELRELNIIINRL